MKKLLGLILICMTLINTGTAVQAGGTVSIKGSPMISEQSEDSEHTIDSLLRKAKHFIHYIKREKEWLSSDDKEKLLDELYDIVGTLRFYKDTELWRLMAIDDMSEGIKLKFLEICTRLEYWKKHRNGA